MVLYIQNDESNKSPPRFSIPVTTNEKPPDTPRSNVPSDLNKIGLVAELLGAETSRGRANAAALVATDLATEALGFPALFW